MNRTSIASGTIVKITLLLTTAIISVGGAALAPALPAIGAAFEESAAGGLGVRLVLTIPAFFVALSAPFTGYVVDKIGRKSVLSVSLLLSALAGLSAFFAATLTVLLTGRAVLGIAVAGVMVSVTTLVADYYTGEERSRMMGYQAGVAGLADTVLILAVGFLADLTWRASFLIYLFPLLVLPLVLVVLREPTTEEQCEENPPPTGDPGTCAGASVAEESGSQDQSSTSQAVPIKFIAFIYGLTILAEILFTIAPVQLPFYLQDSAGASASQIGLALSLMSLAFAVSATLYGRVASRLDHISVLLVAFSLFGLGFALVSLPNRTATLYLGLIAAGAGLGMLIPNLYVWLANEVPQAIRGRVLGGFTTALYLGQFLSPLVSQPLTIALDIRNTILIAGLVMLALVPLFFVTRRQLRLLAVGR
jgi:MFS family permease